MVVNLTKNPTKDMIFKFGDYEIKTKLLSVTDENGKKRIIFDEC